MAENHYDIYIELTRWDRTIIKGETKDSQVVSQGIEISEFDISFGKASTKSTADLEKKREQLVLGLKGQGVNMAELQRILENQQNQIEMLKKEVAAQAAAARKVVEKKNDPTVDLQFSIKKFVDGSTPALVKAYKDSSPAGDWVFRSAIVTAYRAGGSKQAFLEVAFGCLRIVSYKIDMGEPLPSEDIDFSFGQCQIKYWPQSAKGVNQRQESYAWNFLGWNTWGNAPEPPPSSQKGTRATLKFGSMKP